MKFWVLPLKAASTSLLLALFPVAHTGAAQPSIAAGGAHTCALNQSGGVACWGENTDGALGDGVALRSPVPRPIVRLTSGVAGLASGSFHSCAFTTAGAAFCWGHNGQGQLGNGTFTVSSTPAPVIGLASGVVAMAAGNEHTCALAGGKVHCFGSGFNGQLGNGVMAQSFTPVAVAGLSGVTAIAAGNAHSCALTSAGAVLCWGYNGEGQLGDGTTVDRSLPVTVSGLASGVTAIAAGVGHTCALTAAGAVLCWGDNRSGQLGIGSRNRALVPTPVAGISSGAKGVTAGSYHSCALAAPGAMSCWGSNFYGALGDGTSSNSTVPVPVSGLSAVAAMSAGPAYEYTCAVDAAGAAHCWGANDKGQLGNGGFVGRNRPAPVVGIPSPVAKIATGAYHACALTVGGGVHCWGDDSSMQLGNGRAIGSSTPVPVAGLSSGMAGIAAGSGYFTCAIAESGGVSCWGSGVESSTPIAIPFLPSGITTIAVGFQHACALTGTGAVYCMGSNAQGQLGNGTTTDSLIPVIPIGLGSGVIAIAAGQYHSCAVTAAGAALCWGDNEDGALGNGATVPSTVPVPVSGLSSGVRSIASYAFHTCAVTDGGGVWCWGFGEWGQLGDGRTSSSAVPVAVSGLSQGAASVALGLYFSCALTSTGGVKCWGDNDYGSLGTGDRTPSDVPVDVGGLGSGVSGIAAGSHHACALTGGAGVRCWGLNDSGGLGDGTFADRTRAAVVVREAGAGTLAGNDWFLHLDPRAAETIPADRVPAYLVVTSGNAKTAIVDIAIDAQFRAQDRGKAIHVFAYAPASAVGAAGRVASKEDACVLAQLTPSGSLQQTSAAGLQALAGNVTSAQRQAVRVLENVAAASVAGATFCVGAGASGSESVSAANSRCVATIPGPRTCVAPEAAASSAQLPGPLSGLWWNAGEAGWGISFTQRRNVVFAAWYTYDAAGNPKWYVASSCTMPEGMTGARGTCDGALYEVTAAAFFGAAFDPASVRVQAVGSLRVAFDDANRASMSYTLNGQTRSVLLARQLFASGAPPAIDYTDLWWNPGESGWGMAITQQGNTMFLAWYVYDNAGRPVWYVASNCAVSGSGCSGSLYRTTGPPFGPSFDPTRVQVISVGTVSVAFSDGDNGTLTYTLGGVTGNKAITRQLF